MDENGNPYRYSNINVKNFSTIRFDNATWGKTITVHYFANQSTDSTVTKVDATNVAFSGVDSLSSGDSYDMLTIDEELASGSLELTSENSTYTIGTTLEGTGKVSLSDDGKTVTYTVDSASEQASSQSTVDSASEQASSQSTVDSASEQGTSIFSIPEYRVKGAESGFSFCTRIFSIPCCCYDYVSRYSCINSGCRYNFCCRI